MAVIVAQLCPPAVKASWRDRYVSYDEWEADLAVVPDAEKEAWIYDTLRDKAHLHIFGRYFFPHIIKGTDDVPEAHLDLIHELSEPRDSAIIFPRGFAKSTWEKIDTIHDIVYKLEPVILYISTTLSDAGLHFESIKAELEGNDLLRLVYGNLVPPDSLTGRKWTNKHFETTNGVNVVARGASKGRGVNIKNQRPTKIICDDVEDDDQVRSVLRRNKLNRWLYETIFPSKDKKRGRIKLIGTVLHRSCELLKFYHAHGGIYRQAIENGKSIWPKYWTLEDLFKIRDGYTDAAGKQVKGIGTRAFNQEYMNNPTSDEMANFPAEYIDAHVYSALPVMVNKRVVIYMDPMGGQKSTSDEYAISVLVYSEKDPHRYLTEQKAGRATQLQQAAEFIKIWLRYRQYRVIAAVEVVLNQTAVYQNILAWRAGQISLAAYGVPDDSPRDIPLGRHDPKGKDKVARMQNQEAAFERGEVHLRAEMTELRDQVLFLGRDVIENDDRADSLIGALELSFAGGGGIEDAGESVYNKNKTAPKTVGGNLYSEDF